MKDRTQSKTSSLVDSLGENLVEGGVKAAVHILGWPFTGMLRNSLRTRRAWQIRVPACLAVSTAALGVVAVSIMGLDTWYSSDAASFVDAGNRIWQVMTRDPWPHFVLAPLLLLGFVYGFAVFAGSLKYLLGGATEEDREIDNFIEWCIPATTINYDYLARRARIIRPIDENKEFKTVMEIGLDAQGGMMEEFWTGMTPAEKTTLIRAAYEKDKEVALPIIVRRLPREQQQMFAEKHIALALRRFAGRG
jgi:hypothetical protein